MAGAAPRWVDILALARRADDVGLDSLWVADDLLVRDEQGTSGPWEAFALLAALAAATARVELAPLVARASIRNSAVRPSASLKNTWDMSRRASRTFSSAWSR